MPYRSSTTRRRWAVALASLLLAGVAAGCSEGSSDAQGKPGSTPTTTPSGTPTARPSAAYPDYVALGDSYTAAPLVPQTDTSNGCLRSSNNYPSLVAAALPGTTLHDASCSGAETSDMTGPQQTGDAPQPPQFDVLSEDTDLVTLGIGGNDYNLFGTLIGTCSQLRNGDPSGSPCRDRFTVGGVDVLARDLPRIRRNVAAVIAGIRDRAPSATVVVVGYPQLIPDRGICPQLLPLATGDYAYARRISAGLDAAVRAGSRRADGYVDL